MIAGQNALSARLYREQSPPIAASVDPQQVQQLALDVAAVRQSVEQVAASQTKMAAEIDNLLVTDMEIFLKIPTPPPAALSHKPIPAARRREHRTAALM